MGGWGGLSAMFGEIYCLFLRQKKLISVNACFCLNRCKLFIINNVKELVGCEYDSRMIVE